VKLVLDEMMPLAVAVELRRRGHDVEGVAERATLRGGSDPAVWASVIIEGSVLVTEDTDYRVFLRMTLPAGQTHPGIVFTSTRRFPRGDPRTVGRLVTALDELLASGVDLAGREYWLR